MTSHDVVDEVRRITGVRKVGHGGTLDPLATGLLVVGLGQATKELNRFAVGDKTYLATARLGRRSATDDAEGEVTEVPGAKQPSQATVRETLRSFAGEQEQLPPAYSAIKTGGKKHYELARAGHAVPVKPRRVTIRDIELVSYDWPDLTFRVTVSKGTYIRALARDLGERLGSGGYLASLRREAVGNYSVEEATSIDTLDGEWRRQLIPIRN